MTKLNEDQQRSLTQVTDVKALVDEEIAKRTEVYMRELEEAKSPLYVAVAEAARLRVPARQLGFALGTSDHKTIKSYFPVAATEEN
jgi:hypothetical protein